MVKLKALIFDVDGTLAETEEAHRRAFNEAFDAHGLTWNWTVAQYRRLLRTTGGKERMMRHRGDIGAKEPSDDEIAALHKAKTALYGTLVASGAAGLRPGVPELIAAARTAGLKLAVATTTNLPNVEVLTRAAWGRPADEVFDVIAAGDQVNAKKPAPDVYLLALDRLGLSAQDCIAFEDSVNGVRSARAAGLRVVVTPSVYTADEDFSDADWVAPTLEPGNLPAELWLG